jgi:hypothetical protein
LAAVGMKSQDEILINVANDDKRPDKQVITGNNYRKYYEKSSKCLKRCAKIKPKTNCFVRTLVLNMKRVVTAVKTPPPTPPRSVREGL